MTPPVQLPCVTLRKNEDHRIVSGHPWVFSNEIAGVTGTPAVGDVVVVRSAKGTSLGVGFYHPHSLIAVRMLSSAVEEISRDFLRNRISTALALRSRLYPGSTTYRLVHGESDYLPGLIVDKYGDCLSLQTLSYGMDRRLDMLCEILEEMFHPRGIIARNESPLRTLEHLPVHTSILKGDVTQVEFVEHNLRYQPDLATGQKTGFFLDQRENRFAVRRYAPNARVLDCFCNDGGFALNAAAGGAAYVTAVDISPEAISRARRNTLLNDLSTVRFEHADVFDTLKALREQQEQFDLIVLDPPSFTKSKKTVQAARKGYKTLHILAMEVLVRGGILFTSSCSHHITPETFIEAIQHAAQRTGRHIQLLEWRGASPDHPTLPAAPETRYLKTAVVRVL